MASRLGSLPEKDTSERFGCAMGVSGGGTVAGGGLVLPGPDIT